MANLADAAKTIAQRYRGADDLAAVSVDEVRAVFESTGQAIA